MEYKNNEASRFVGILRSLIEKDDDSSILGKVLNKLNYAKYGKVNNRLISIRESIDNWIKSNYSIIESGVKESNLIEIDEPDEYCPVKRIMAYDEHGEYLVRLHKYEGMKECGKNHKYHNHPETITEKDLIDGIKGVKTIISFDKKLTESFSDLLETLIQKPIKFNNNGKTANK